MLKDKKIIQEIEEYDEIKKENEFKDFLNQRKMSYADNIFNKKSTDELFKKSKNYLRYNHAEFSCQEMILYSVVTPLSILASIPITYYMRMSNIYTGDPYLPVFLIVLAILILSAGIISSPLFRKFIFKRWLKNNRDELFENFLKDLPVNQNVLKRFVNVYGKEELAILMSERNTLTYGDIFSYVHNSKNKKEIKNKRDKLNEALVFME